MIDNSITLLLKSKKTVFSTKDLILIWQIPEPNYLKTKIYRLVKNGQLNRVRNGLYAIDSNYLKDELANKIIIPSYISLQTVLLRAGIIFQYDSAIYSISKLSKEIIIDKQKYVYKKIKDSVLLNSSGIVRKENYDVASCERALLDTLYLYGDFYFDNLAKIDWQICSEIVKIYDNKSLEKKLAKLRKLYA
ncbi:MAG: hypothetical protein ACD_58C00213G0003 [uncultured bacterium]|nr:MAG: hypothetical protein ACD_58C00213G0003 [uncultured bacterium]